MKSFKEFKLRAINEGVASTIAKQVPWKKVAAKVGGAFLAAKSGEKLLKDLLGSKDDPRPMRDVYNKDLTGNARFDNKLDPTGEQKKPSLGKLRQGAKVRKQQKRSEIKRNMKKDVSEGAHKKFEDKTSTPLSNSLDYSKGISVTGRLDFGKGKTSDYDVGVNYKGRNLFRKTKKTETKERTSPKDAVDAALNKLNNKTPSKGERTT